MSSLTGSSSSSSDGSPAKLRDDGLRVPDIYLIEGLKNMSPNWFIGSSSYIESVSLELEKLREELSIRSSSSSLPDHKRPRREEETFDFEDADMCGLVFGLGDSLVRVDLMTFKSDESQIQPTSVFVFAPKGFRTDFSVGWSFAVVKSKLFATGGQAKCYFSTPDYPREVYYCDLRDAFTMNTVDGKYFLEFKVAATLNSPKISALLVPYKNKIFFIADPSNEPELVETPCEVLHLGAFNAKPFNVKPLPSPMFWKGRNPRDYHYLNGHVVLTNKLYVRVWGFPILYCLDMDTEIWESSKEDCAVPPILKGIYEDKDERPWNYVHGDKLFKFEMNKEDPSIFSLTVEILDDDDGNVRRAVNLQGIVDSMGLEGRCYIYDGWVLPCEEKTSTDVFCLMFWVCNLTKDSYDFFYLCKFRLADNGSFNRLTRVICVPLPYYCGELFLGFTPGISKALNSAAYDMKLFDRDFVLRRKEDNISMEIEEAKREEARREEAKRQQEEEEEEAKREEEEAHREDAAYYDAEIIDFYLRLCRHRSRRMRRYRL
ncbi:hypothetical protein LINGRAHAP2_LOCUS28965 [Linum grandiflorum]